ncbi:hypothetical protein UlMin_042008 [Ulmus minor]
MAISPMQPNSSHSINETPGLLHSISTQRGYKQFFRRNLLETSDYLKDDFSALDCPQLYSIQVLESDIGAHFGTLLETMDGSDITFDVAGEKFHAHKLVLVARFPVFHSEYLEEFTKEKVNVVVTYLEPKVFKAMLHFIYRYSLIEDVEMETSNSSSLSLISDSLTGKLLAGAERYGLERLRLMCESHFCKDILVNSIAEILALVDQYNASDLKVFCLKFAGEYLAGKFSYHLFFCFLY